MYSPILFPLLASVFSWLFFAGIISLFFSDSPKSNWNLLAMIRNNKEMMAKEIASYIKLQIGATDFLDKQLKNPSVFNDIKPDIEQHVDHFIKEKLVKKWPVISILGGDEVLDKIKLNLMEELESIIPMLLQKYSGNLLGNIPVENLITEHLSNVSAHEIYQIIFAKSKKIRQAIPLIAALNGLIIGIIFLLF